MGLSNYNRYTVTEHAKIRYKERLRDDLTELDILKDFTKIMQEVKFLSKENQGRQSWFHRERELVLITDPKSYLVITIYRTLDEYKKELKSDIKTEKNTRRTHPEVEQLISEAAKKIYQSKQREFLAETAPMYEEFAERMAKLAKTTVQDAFDRKHLELTTLKAAIQETEDEYQEILDSLQTYFKEE